MSNTHQSLWDQLQEIDNPEALRRFTIDHPQVRCVDTVEKLHAEIVSGIVVDSARAQRLAMLARWIANDLEDNHAKAVADRCEGHVHYAAAHYDAALGCYESAAGRFEQLGRESDVAKTLNGAIQTLIYLGRYDQAIEFAARARPIFERESDGLRLARLDSNVGNIFYRQDRYAEAHQIYRSAYQRLIALNRPRDAAAVLSNMAVASTGMGDFARAAEEYRESQRIATSEGMTALAAELDYNVAYLHFLRGDYTEAITLYRQARRHSEHAGDAYHAALCDLDLAEVYLDLNLVAEGRLLASRAAGSFENLGMDYERAKAFSAITEQRSGNVSRALVLFSASRRLFSRGNNTVWPAIIDTYRAILLRERGQAPAALKIVVRARLVFASAGLHNRLAFVDLFLAEMLLDRGKHVEALKTTEARRHISLKRIIPWCFSMPSI
jgi:tetratricopeptide (TPR) repeat protein